MAGEQGGNGIYYWSNNGIDITKIMLEETTAPGFGYDADDAVFARPSGKSFIKWNTAADGSGTDYFPGDNVEELLGTDVNLYAIWGDIPLIVQKSSIEDIADAVRGKLTGSSALTDKTLSDLPTIITNLPILEFSTTPILQNYGSTSIAKNSGADYEVGIMPYTHKGRPFVYLTVIGTSNDKRLGALVVIGIPNGGTENEGYRLIWYKVGYFSSSTGAVAQSVSLFQNTGNPPYLALRIHNGSSVQGQYGQGSSSTYGQVAYEF